MSNASSVRVSFSTVGSPSGMERRCRGAPRNSSRAQASSERCETFLQNARLHFVHFRGGVRLLIVVAVEMEQAVNDVKRQLVIESLGKTRGVALRGVRADDDFAMLEGDDIGRARNAHELLVNARDFFVGNNRDLDTS